MFTLASTATGGTSRSGATPSRRCAWSATGSMPTEADRLSFVRLRPLATVRARTVLGGSLALGIALLLSVSTAGGLLRRSLIRSIDEVAEVRAAEVAALPSGA